MKSLIVTGGANGLGRSIAESASKAGYRVGILDVNIGALEEAASSIENATPLVASVTSTDEVRAALEEFGQTPDIWVNNAGIVRFAPYLSYQKMIGGLLLISILQARLSAPRSLRKRWQSVAQVQS